MDFAYLSNLREYAEAYSSLDHFRQALKQLRSCATDQTLIIDTSPRFNGVLSKETLTQRVTRKFLSANLKLSFPASEGFDVKKFKENKTEFLKSYHSKKNKN